MFQQHLGGGNAHAGGEDVVGGLRLVHVVVRGEIQWHIVQLAPVHQLSEVCDDLVDIHVGLGARTCLPDMQRELVVPFACEDLVACLHDKVSLVGGQDAKVAIGASCRLFRDW